MRVRSWVSGLAMAAAVAIFSGSAGAQTLNFSASGDFGRFASTQKTALVMQGIAGSNSQFHLALGDLSYQAAGTEQAWCTTVKSYVGDTFPFQLLAGNHDSGERNTPATGSAFWETHIDNFANCLPNRLPGMMGTYGRRWYADQPAANPLVRVIMADANIKYFDPVTHAATGAPTYAAGTSEYNWVANAIDDARAKQIPWVILGVHRPCITVGDYNCDASWSMGPDLFDLAISKKVDLILHGHEHHYSRTHQLGTSTTCAAPANVRTGTANTGCIRDSDSAMEKGKGSVIAIVGTGGIALRNINTSDAEMPYFAATSGANLNPTWGSTFFSVTPAKLTANFVPVSGTFTDSFTITDPTPPDPPADRDRDGVVDTVDLCPTRPGPASRRGCPTTFTGTTAANVITGSPFNDTIWGLAGHDVLRGGLASDRVYGGIGRDTLIGDAGNDILVGATQRDTFWGGQGNDVINSRDGIREVVNCGAGADRVIADRLDVVRGCEKVTRK